MLRPTLLSACLAVIFVTGVRRVRGMARFNAWVAGSYGGGPTLSYNVWVLTSLLVLLSALVGWPAAWLWRRARGARPGRSLGERLAVWLALATSLTGLLFFVLLAYAAGQTHAANRHVLAVGVVDGFGWVFLLPWALAALTLGLAAAAVVAWRRGYWGRWMRAHYALVAAASVSLVAFVAYWPLV